jgi:hypothetical protein
LPCNVKSIATADPPADSVYRRHIDGIATLVYDWKLNAGERDHPATEGPLRAV